MFQNEKDCIRILGIKIDKKTDITSTIACIISLLAFLFSIVSIATNFYLYIIGAKVILVKPKQVTLLQYESQANNVMYFKLYSDIYFVNMASPGYDDVVSSVDANVLIGNELVDLKWLYSAITDLDNNGKIIEKDRKPAAPILVKARQTAGYEIHFYPFPTNNAAGFSNHVTWDSFKEKIRKNQGKAINITFKFATFSEKQGEADCKISITENVLAAIEKNGRANVVCD